MLAIFKRDFAAYFTSPIGYVYIGAYILVLNLMFYINNALGSSSSLSNVFSFMLTMMMFLTPILTMRIFSEELKTKTDQLLLTTPVSLPSIVIGKFLSALAIFSCVLVLTLLWVFIISFYGENNKSEVIGSYIGIFCLGAAYISMGIFISSKTENQVIAAIGSLGLYVALFLLDMIIMFFSADSILPAVVIRVLRFISINGRFSDITRGLLTLDGIVFFISISAVFLALTVRGFEKRRWG